MIVRELLFIVGIIIAAIRAIQSASIFYKKTPLSISQASIGLGNSKINNSGNKCLNNLLRRDIYLERSRREEEQDDKGQLQQQQQQQQPLVSVEGPVRLTEAVEDSLEVASV